VSARCAESEDSKPKTHINDRDDRTACLNELMTQAVLGAGSAITPGVTAHEVWVPMLVDYGKTGNSRKQADGEGSSTQLSLDTAGDQLGVSLSTVNVGDDRSRV